MKDEPLWSEDSEKDIPVTCRTLIVDDAHRQGKFGRVLQLIQETASYRNLKLIVSTRPGSATPLLQQVLRKIDVMQVLQLPELRELNSQQSRALAEQVLGSDFRNFASLLAEIGSNSPLVIVAGGRLIASHKINPSALTTLQEFRSTIFNRLLDEMDLQGPKFAIDPRLVLHLIAMLGPVDVEQHDFQLSAQRLLGRRVDEILITVDALASNGIITPRPKPVRVLPDVLSDYLIEERCIGPAGRSTGYADRVYELFGAHSLKNLMRNLAELDWRLGQSGETGLNLLDGIWADIHQRFRAGDESARHQILTDISGGAIYQPNHVITLIRTAINDPIQLDTACEGSRYREGQEYVLSALPSLLEATALHADRLKESVETLWELAKRQSVRGSSSDTAETVLKRLASWHRLGDPTLNFAMLVQAIRLSQRIDAFTGDFTPFTLIAQILEREGEFNEWQDEMTISFGAFGLNYAAVGPVRESALDYLDFALEGDGSPAPLASISIMQNLLHHFLNRAGRESAEQEKDWQNRERARCLQTLLRRYAQPGSPILKARIYNALRSATGIHCPEPIRQSAAAALANIIVDDSVAVVDAICTEEHQLPLLSTDFSEAGWERPVTELMMKGRSSLERLVVGARNQARFTIDQTQACIEIRVKTGGFHRFMFSFADRPDFLTEMAEQLISHPHIGEMVGHLSSVLHSMHVADPAAFRERALTALRSGAVHVIHASANNLRVFEGATEEDIALIQAYAGYSDPVAKRGAIFAITYMGKFTELRPNLKDAVLSIHTDGDQAIAAYLADAFGPYGVPLTSLTRDEAAAVASEFLLVHDWEFDQGAIPRFLSRFANLFPDETYNLLLARIERSSSARDEHERGFRSFGLVHANISFGGVPAEKRQQLGQDCLTRLIASHSAEGLAGLFWSVTGSEEPALQLILNIALNADERGVHNIATLIDLAIPHLAFVNRSFAKEFLSQFNGEQRQRIVDALAHQARRFGGGGFQGDPDEYMAQRHKQFADQVAALADEVGLEDLVRALRRFT